MLHGSFHLLHPLIVVARGGLDGKTEGPGPATAPVGWSSGSRTVGRPVGAGRPANGGTLTLVLFMVIERFKDGQPRPVYERAATGRRMPDGLRYVDSWVEANFARCFQLMECDDLTLLMTWIANWSDLVDFEVVPVVTSAQAAAALPPPGR